MPVFYSVSAYDKQYSWIFCQKNQIFGIFAFHRLMPLVTGVVTFSRSDDMQIQYIYQATTLLSITF